MASHSFDIKNAVDLFHAMNEAIDEYLNVDNLTTTRKALECAMLSWHLVDWIHKEYPSINKLFSGKKAGLRKYQLYLKSKCKSLCYMEDIANGTKHMEHNYDPRIKTTGPHRGNFSPDAFTRDFDVPSLEMMLDDGTVVLFDDEIEKVRDFWKDYFINTLGKHV